MGRSPARCRPGEWRTAMAGRAQPFESRFRESKHPVCLVDSTMRDGEQNAGVVFANQEKVRIARLLSELGVKEIEAGTPCLCPEEREAIAQVCALDLPSRILAYCRAAAADVRMSAECGVGGVVIWESFSDLPASRFHPGLAALTKKVEEAVEAAKDAGLPFIFCAEDASRTRMDVLLAAAVAAHEMGAERFRFCDTLSVLNPFTAFQRVQVLLETADLDVEIHCHNDFGMATANALAGIRAGAQFVTVSVNGLGERTGNPPLEEVVMALKYLDSIDLGIATSRFREVSEYVARASSRAIPIWKAIVGENVFAHESGIHADGVLKNPLTYEVFSPDEVGLTRQLVVGKHSGSRTIQHKFHEFGIDLTDVEADMILARVRQLAVELKRALFDKELVYIYQDFLRENEERKAAGKIGVMDDGTYEAAEE